MSDLSIFDSVSNANKGEELVLLHPVTQEETDVKIRLMGSDSDEFRSTTKKNFEQYQRKANGKGKQKIDLDETEERSIQLLAKMTVSWEGIEEDGEAVPCTFENAIRIYKSYPSIKEQVDKFVHDRTNFIEG